MNLAPLETFETLGELLKYLRRRARLSQRELSIAVGYSESQICRLESNQRMPDRASLLALFVPTLGIEDEPEAIDRLLRLADSQLDKQPAADKQPAEGKPPALAHPQAAPQGSTPTSTLPSGMLTYLFTDIEGSTPLWEKMPEAMKAAIARHHACLYSTIEAHHGLVFKVIGDAFQAVFQEPEQALQAALASQRALAKIAWGETGPIKVRMGLHTGPGEADPLHPDEYAVSHTLNRVARVMDAGHGGQVLLSEEAAGLARRRLSDGAWLKDLGEHRLKGMDTLEHLYQAVVPDLPQDFPALRSLSASRNHLPPQLTSFVGRVEDLADLIHLLQDPQVRMLTLTGEGGCGKTRLALRAGENVAQDFEHGVWLVELAPVSDPQMLMKTTAAAFGMLEGSGRIEDLLVEYLRPKHLLLILDNCEHLVCAAAAFAQSMLSSCPGLRILATSREALNVPGEELFRVLPLSLPPMLHGSSPLRAETEKYEAIRLFVERARAVERRFTLTDQNAPAVARICSRLDGIPLAIELAAARVNMLRPEQIAARLEENFDLLTGRIRDRMPHHQTMRSAIEWSYQLLSEGERVLLRRLAVFSGGWTLEAAEAVCGYPPLESGQVFDLLANLVNKSLALSDLSGEGEARYRMLEPVRESLLAKLDAAQEAAEIHDRHLAYFVALVEKAEPELISRQQADWIYRLEQEQANLQAAMRCCSEHSRVEQGLRIAGGLWRFWWMTGGWSEGYQWCRDTLRASETDPRLRESVLRARVILAKNFMVLLLGQGEDLLQSIEEGLQLFRKNNDLAGIGAALCLKGAFWPDATEGLAMLEEGLRYSYQAEDGWWIAFNKH